MPPDPLPPIASPPGDTDKMVVTQTWPRRPLDLLPPLLLGIGICFWVDELGYRRRRRTAP